MLRWSHEIPLLGDEMGNRPGVVAYLITQPRVCSNADGKGDGSMLGVEQRLGIRVGMMYLVTDESSMHKAYAAVDCTSRDQKQAVMTLWRAIAPGVVDRTRRDAICRQSCWWRSITQGWGG
jgi:hypothetical protein